MNMCDHFALLAPFYDHIFGPLDPTQLRDLLRLPTPGRLLDAGGGTGRVSEMLRGQAAQIVVVDLSAAMLRQAGRKSGLRVSCAHVERLPFPEDMFERILMVDAFHHLCDQRQAALDLLRVLAPGGRLVVEEPNIETLPVKLIALGERLMLMRSCFYSLADMRRIFEAAGGRVTIESDHAYNAWVIVEKYAS
jgi:ubiquinone/menaquinone biosynthesis C-methylase UbiE